MIRTPTLLILMCFALIKCSTNPLMIYQNLPEPEPDQIGIHFLNVGTGLCVLIEYPGEEVTPLLYDCGSSKRPSRFSADHLKTQIQQVTARHGNSVNVVLSHPHRDHTSLLKHVLEGVNIDHLMFGGEFGSYDNYSLGLKRWSGFQRAVLKPNTSQTSDNPYQQSPVGLLSNAIGGTALDVHIMAVDTYHGTGNISGNAMVNRDSLVLFFDFGDFSMVLTGDAIDQTEVEMLKFMDDFADFPQRLTLVSAAHHGSDTNGSSGAYWTHRSDPQIVTYSSGLFFGHPRCDVSNRYFWRDPAHSTPRLAETLEHASVCNNDGHFFVFNGKSVKADIEHAAYGTKVNGDISIYTNGESIEIHCAQTAHCGFEEGYVSIESL
ncbi:MAG: hypothetical protein COA96_03290 [SAR86 cluster bacterium]|uniref:Metallo-beta-lactamase domain-containing protein n=1 Tax=SAR86 cluster bacterium TaxID=2030880 RepID=A0A2A5B7I8_9GAMM|nr:MAG: hypothetical protein COA96_03290 [SAR86 cluster bacterium]